MNIIKRFFGHWRTVRHHRKLVRQFCFEQGLYWQGLTHDLSKYSPVEFWNGVKYFTGTASPHVGERAEKGHSDAWIHHHNHNKHHAEYWHDIVDGKSACVEIPHKYLVEMVADRVAASKTYLKDTYVPEAPLNYYLTHMEENEYHPKTREKLVDMLTAIARGNKIF